MLPCRQPSHFSQTRLHSNKSWGLCQEAEHTQLSRWFQSLLFCRVCYWPYHYKKTNWLVQKFTAENKLRPTLHQQCRPISEYWLPVVIIYLFLSSFLGLFFFFPLITAVRSFPPLWCLSKFSNGNKCMCVLPHSSWEAELGFCLAAAGA